MKTHYGSCQRANESDNQDYWSNTACGLEYHESPMTDDETEVSCKKCLAKIVKQKDAIERIKNKFGINTSASSFGGCGMGTF